MMTAAECRQSLKDLIEDEAENILRDISDYIEGALEDFQTGIWFEFPTETAPEPVKVVLSRLVKLGYKVPEFESLKANSWISWEE